MLDFEKNRNADSVVTTLCEVEPEVFAIFRIDELLDSECSSAILTIFKTYVEKKI